MTTDIHILRMIFYYPILCWKFWPFFDMTKKKKGNGMWISVVLLSTIWYFINSRLYFYEIRPSWACCLYLLTFQHASSSLKLKIFQGFCFCANENFAGRTKDAKVFYDKYLLLNVCICLNFLRQNLLANTLSENHYNLNNTSLLGKILVYIVIHFALYD